MFYDGSRCFTTVHVLLRRYTIYHNVLQVFHDVLLCLTIFKQVFNDRHRRIGDLAALRERDNAVTTQESAVTPQKSGMTPQGSPISPRM